MNGKGALPRTDAQNAETRVVESARRTVLAVTAAMRPIRAQREMNARPGRTVSDVLTVTEETRETTADNIATKVTSRTPESPVHPMSETVLEENPWSGERETETGSERESGSVRGIATRLTGRRSLWHKTTGVTEEDTAERRGGARAEGRTGTSPVLKGQGGGEDEHRSLPTKVQPVRHGRRRVRSGAALVMTAGSLVVVD